MHRKITKTIAGLGLSLAVVSTQLQFPVQVKAEELEKPKNIVFILADDMGWKDLGCFGSEYYKTPNLDRLAENGMKFTNAYSAAPLCSATRASILTGWSPARQHLHAVTPHTRANYGGFADFEDWTSPPQHTFNKINKTSIPKQLGQFPIGRTTIATMLKEKGYKTGFFGKWHMGPDDDKYPEKHGFDINIGGNHYGWPPSHFDPYGFVTKIDRKKGEYLTDRLTDEALTFIKESNSQKKPFLAYVSHYAVHGPVQAKQEDINLFNGVVDPLGLHDNKVYAGMIKSLDDNVGRIVKTVEELGIANDTIFIFTSDNGGISGYKDEPQVTNMYPLRGCKAYMYEGGIRVPMIAYMPGIVQKGVVSEEPVITTDVFPTLLDFAGVSPKENYPMDGKSLMPLFTGNGEFERDYLTWFFPHNAGFGTRDHLWPNAVIRQGDYKLIKEFGHGYKLYNLREDIGENNNLADTMPELVKELDDKLMTELNKQNAHIPVINPNYNESESLNYINDPKNKAAMYTIYKEKAVVLDDTFSENATGWEASGNASISRSEYLNKTHYLKFSYDSAVGDYHSFITTLPSQLASTNLEVEFDVNFRALKNTSTNANPIIQIKGGVSNATLIQQTAINTNGAMTFTGGATKSINLNEWHKLKFVIDNSSNNTYKAYVDGALVVNSANLQNSSAIGLIQIAAAYDSVILTKNLSIKDNGIVIREDKGVMDTTRWTKPANNSQLSSMPEYDNETNTVLLTKGDATNNAYQAFNYALGNQIESADSSTAISASFKLYIESLEKNNANPVIQFKGSASNNTLYTSIDIDPSNNIATITNGTSNVGSIQLARKRWYDVKWIYNTTTRAFSVYFDNSLVVSGTSNSTIGGNPINPKFGLVSYLTQKGSEVLFDDIVIKNGESIVSSNDMQTNTNNWSKSVVASIMQIAEEPTSISNKGLFIKGDINKEAYQVFTTPIITSQAGTNVEVSFKLRIPYINDGVGNNQVIQLRNANHTHITQIQITKEHIATFYSRNGSVTGTLNLPTSTLSASKWYDVKFIIDTTTKKMWAYLDNQVIINDLYCLNDPGTGFAYISTHVQKDTEMILDEVKVTNNGTIPLLQDFETGTNSWTAPATGSHVLETREYASKLYVSTNGYSEGYATIKRTVDLTGLTNKIYLAEITLNPDVVNDTIPITFKNAANSVAQILIKKQDVLPNPNRFEKTYERSNNLDLKVYLDFYNKVCYTVMNDVVVGFKMPFSTEQTTFDSVELGLSKSSKVMINSFKITALVSLPVITRPDSFEVRSNITDGNNNPIDSIVGIKQAGGIFKIVNNNDNTQNLVGILSFYEDRKLVNVKTLPINIAANGYTNVNIDDKITISMTDGKAYSIKLVLWDSLSNMTPITNMSLIE